MSILNHSPSIVRNGLVLCLDAGAVRSYPIFRGSNLITNGEFTTDTTAWAGYGGTTLSRVTASSDPGVPSGGTDDYCLKVNGTYFAYDPISTTTGKHYFVRLRGYDASGGNSLKISATSDGATLTGVPSVAVSGAEWKTYTSSFIAEGTTTYIRIGANSGGGSVSYWDKVEVYEAIWADLSGNFNDGVINGLDGLSAESGAGGTKSFDFDGSSDYISFSAKDYGISATWTVAWWMKMDSSGLQCFFSMKESGSNNKIEFITNSGIREIFGNLRDHDGTVIQVDTDNTVWNTGEWTHVAITNNGGTATSSAISFYINGEAKSNNVVNGATITPMEAGSRTLNIGKEESGSRYVDGKMAIVHMYSRALTASEIQQNYRTHKGRFGR